MILFDEAGTKEGMATREWYSIQNKMLSYVMQVFRHKRLIVFFSVPDISYIDKQAIKLFHMLFITSGINHKKKVCMIKPFIISPSRRADKIYYLYHKINSSEGMVRLTRLEVGLPSVKLRHAYEKIKESFTEGLYCDAIQRLDNTQSLDALTDRQRVIYDLRKHGKMNYTEIAERLGVVPNTISQTIKTIKRKGYQV